MFWKKIFSVFFMQNFSNFSKDKNRKKKKMKKQNYQKVFFHTKTKKLTEFRGSGPVELKSVDFHRSPVHHQYRSALDFMKIFAGAAEFELQKLHFGNFQIARNDRVSDVFSLHRRPKAEAIEPANVLFVWNVQNDPCIFIWAQRPCP